MEDISSNLKQTLSFDESIKIKIIIEFSYRTEIKEINNYWVRIDQKKQILLNEITEDLIGQGLNYLKNTAMSYYDSELKSYIYLGISPLQSSIKLKFDYERFSKNAENEIFIVKINKKNN
jgi:hypothetical protein